MQNKVAFKQYFYTQDDMNVVLYHSFSFVLLFYWKYYITLWIKENYKKEHYDQRWIPSPFVMISSFKLNFCSN